MKFTLRSEKGLGILLALVVLFFSFQFAIAPWLVRLALDRLITKPCAHCSLEVKSVTVQVFGPGLTLSGVRFTANIGGSTTLAAEIPLLILKMYPLGLFKRKLHLGPIELRDAVVSILERQNKKKREGSGRAEDTSPTSFEVDGIVIHKADFTYAHDQGSKQGAIRVHDIELQVQRFGTIPELKKQKFYGHATGRLEKSGRFDLNANADFFSAEPDVNVELKLTGQDLAEVNAYFDPADGVTLGGRLVDGHALVAIKGATSESKVAATYENLSFTAKKTESRSAFTAFLTNLMGGLAMGGQNLNDTPAEKTRTATLQREADQTVLAFILHSMKAAALKIPARKK